MNVNIFARRLAELRTKNHLTQKQLANELSKLLGPTGVKAEAISSITISSYERGGRMPIVNTLVAICQLFDVSLDYMVGLDNTPEIKRADKKNVLPYEEPDILIDPKELKKYHGNPVFVMSSTHKGLKPRWAILDYENRRLVSSNSFIPLTSDLQLFQYRPIEAQFLDVSFKQPLTLPQLIEETDSVYVKMLNADAVVSGEYDGWYRHNELHSALINEANGLVLPYSGCALSYNAYHIK